MISLRNFLRPSLTLDGVDVRTFVLIAVGIHFSVSAQEGSLIESVLVWHVACLGNLIQLSVKQIG